MFAPFKLQSVNISSSAKNGPAFAFVFMTQNDAAGFNSLHPQGFKYHGRWVKVRPMKQKGITIAAPASQVADSSGSTKPPPISESPLAKSATVVPKTRVVPPGPTYVRINNISYSTKKLDLRDMLKGFEVTKVDIKKGYGFVGLASLKDAQLATARLSGRKLLGRTVSVKVTGPRPSHG